jgi:hypothetical protein
VEGHIFQSKKFYNYFSGKANIEFVAVKQDEHQIFNMVRAIQVPYGKMTNNGKKRNRYKLLENLPFSYVIVLTHTPEAFLS